MTGPNTGGGPPNPPGRGAPPGPGTGRPQLNFKEREALAARQRSEALAAERGSAKAGAFLEVDLERLRTIGGAGLMLPRKERGAPGSTEIAGQTYMILDMTINEGQPEFWVRYLFDEIVNDKSKAELVACPGRARLLDFYNRCFLRPEDFDAIAKPYVIPRGRTILEFYPAGLDGQRLLASHLRAAMDLGFDWMQFASAKDGTSNHSSSMVHAVEHIMRIEKKTQHTPLVWRTEDRRTMRELRSPGFTQQTTVDHRIKTLGMDQTWNPYSTEEVRGRLWYRRQNTDNCLYTGISVALNPKASLVFPKITLSPTSLAPVANAVDAGLKLKQTVEQIVLEPNGEVKAQFAPYIALIELPGRVFKLVLYSRARTILMALEGDYLDTQGVQAHAIPKRGGQLDRSQSFPEYGSVGIQGKNIFAQVELHRFFHGWSDDTGFTAFVNRANCDIVGREEIVEAFAEEKARTEYFQKVHSTYESLIAGAPYGLAWGASGGGYNETPPLFASAVAAWVNGRRLTLR